MSDSCQQRRIPRADLVRLNDVGETYEAGNPLSLCAALTRALDSERQSAIRARMPRTAEGHSMRKLVNNYIASFSC